VREPQTPLGSGMPPTGVGGWLRSSLLRATYCPLFSEYPRTPFSFLLYGPSISRCDFHTGGGHFKFQPIMDAPVSNRTALCSILAFRRFCLPIEVVQVKKPSNLIAPSCCPGALAGPSAPAGTEEQKRAAMLQQ
jgi:hypothetical protein